MYGICSKESSGLIFKKIYFLIFPLQLEILPHKPIKEGFHLLTIEGAPPTNFVHCELEGGGATLHHGKTLHFAFGNTTDRIWMHLTQIFGFYLLINFKIR